MHIERIVTFFCFQNLLTISYNYSQIIQLIYDIIIHKQHREQFRIYRNSPFIMAGVVLTRRWLWYSEISWKTTHHHKCLAKVWHGMSDWNM